MALDLKRHLPSTAFVVATLMVVAAFSGVLIYAGVYNIGADAPHSRLVYGLLRDVRERAIAHHSRDIIVPNDLDDPKRIGAGAGLYNEMCTGCHLGPGVEKSEMSQGLYPQAPALAKGNSHTPAQQFWIIKHGVKLSAMPAWGKTHNDELIWDMVAFLQRLPKMSTDQFKAAVESAPADHDEMMKDMAGVSAEAAASQHHTHREQRDHSHSD